MNATCYGLTVGRCRILVRVAQVLFCMRLTERGYVNAVNSFGTGPIISLNILDSRLV